MLYEYYGNFKKPRRDLLITSRLNTKDATTTITTYQKIPKYHNHEDNDNNKSKSPLINVHCMALQTFRIYPAHVTVLL